MSLLTTEAQAFIDACEVKHDAHAEWLKAMNPPPAVKVERVHVPRVVTDVRRPAPKDFPMDWGLQVDTAINADKASGAYDRARDQFAIRAELYMEGR